METFSTFSQYSCLKPNYKKCKIAGIRVLKSVTVAACGMMSDCARIYIGHFSFKSVNKFFYNIIKTLPKFPHFVVRSCADCTRGGCDGAITLTQ